MAAGERSVEEWLNVSLDDVVKLQRDALRANYRQRSPRDGVILKLKNPGKRRVTERNLYRHQSPMGVVKPKKRQRGWAVVNNRQLQEDPRNEKSGNVARGKNPTLNLTLDQRLGTALETTEKAMKEEAKQRKQFLNKTRVAVFKKNSAQVPSSASAGKLNAASMGRSTVTPNLHGPVRASPRQRRREPYSLPPIGTGAGRRRSSKAGGVPRVSIASYFPDEFDIYRPRPTTALNRGRFAKQRAAVVVKREKLEHQVAVHPFVRRRPNRVYQPPETIVSREYRPPIIRLRDTVQESYTRPQSVDGPSDLGSFTSLLAQRKPALQNLSTSAEVAMEHYAGTGFGATPVSTRFVAIDLNDGPQENTVFRKSFLPPPDKPFSLSNEDKALMKKLKVVTDLTAIASHSHAVTMGPIPRTGNIRRSGNQGPNGESNPLYGGRSVPPSQHLPAGQPSTQPSTDSQNIDEGRVNRHHANVTKGGIVDESSSGDDMNYTLSGQQGAERSVRKLRSRKRRSGLLVGGSTVKRELDPDEEYYPRIIQQPQRHRR